MLPRLPGRGTDHHRQRPGRLLHPPHRAARHAPAGGGRARATGPVRSAGNPGKLRADGNGEHPRSRADPGKHRLRRVHLAERAPHRWAAGRAVGRDQLRHPPRAGALGQQPHPAVGDPEGGLRHRLHCPPFRPRPLRRHLQARTQLGDQAARHRRSRHDASHDVRTAVVHRHRHERRYPAADELGEPDPDHTGGGVLGVAFLHRRLARFQAPYAGHGRPGGAGRRHGLRRQRLQHVLRARRGVLRLGHHVHLPAADRAFPRDERTPPRRRRSGGTGEAHSRRHHAAAELAGARRGTGTGGAAGGRRPCTGAPRRNPARRRRGGRGRQRGERSHAHRRIAAGIERRACPCGRRQPQPGKPAGGARRQARCRYAAGVDRASARSRAERKAAHRPAGRPRRRLVRRPAAADHACGRPRLVCDRPVESVVDRGVGPGRDLPLRARPRHPCRPHHRHRPAHAPGPPDHARPCPGNAGARHRPGVRQDRHAHPRPPLRTPGGPAGRPQRSRSRRDRRGTRSRLGTPHRQSAARVGPIHRDRQPDPQHARPRRRRPYRWPHLSTGLAAFRCRQRNATRAAGIGR